MLLDDIVTILQTASVGTDGVNIFQTSKASIPPGDGPYLSVKESGGSGPEGTHNSEFIGMPGYVRPNAQFIVRALDYDVAMTMARAAWFAMRRTKNQFVNGVWWKHVICLQEPNDLMGIDDLGRAQVSFNVSVTKRLDSTNV